MPDNLAYMITPTLRGCKMMMPTVHSSFLLIIVTNNHESIHRSIFLTTYSTWV